MQEKRQKRFSHSPHYACLANEAVRVTILLPDINSLKTLSRPFSDRKCQKKSRIWQKWETWIKDLETYIKIRFITGIKVFFPGKYLFWKRKKYVRRLFVLFWEKEWLSQEKRLGVVDKKKTWLATSLQD